MRIVCPSCSAKYNLDDSRVPPQGASIKCPKCKHSFIVKPGAGSVPPTAAAPPPPPSSPPEPPDNTLPPPPSASFSPASTESPIPLPGQGSGEETQVAPPQGETGANSALADTVSGRVAHASDAIPLPGHGFAPPPSGEEDDSGGISMDDIFGGEAMPPPPADQESESTSVEELADIFGEATPPSGASFVSLSTENPANSGDGNAHDDLGEGRTDSGDCIARRRRRTKEVSGGSGAQGFLRQRDWGDRPRVESPRRTPRGANSPRPRLGRRP